MSSFPVLLLFWRQCAPHYLDYVTAIVQLAVYRSSRLGAHRPPKFLETLHVGEFGCCRARLLMVLWGRMTLLEKELIPLFRNLPTGESVQVGSRVHRDAPY